MNENLKERLKKIERSTKEDCRMLYDTDFQWESGEGWNEIIQKFSYKCEELNIRFHGKYRLRILAEQIKQKYGNLRLYCSVTTDPCRIVSFLISSIDYLVSKISAVDFAFKWVEREPSMNNHIIKVFSNDDEYLMKSSNDLTTAYTIELDDKTAVVTNTRSFPKRQIVPTRHKIRYHISNILKSICCLFYKIPKISYFHLNDTERNVIRQYMQDKLDEYISEAESEAESTCEFCGKQLDEKYEKPCHTHGWISIACERCAIESNREYTKEGKIYKNGKYIREEKEL